MPNFTTDRRKVRDRRVAPREASAGIVEISFSDPLPTRIQAALLETSAVGFRASYDAKALEPGRDISFERDGQRGAARVLWTHVIEGQKISGFLLL
jgi:hypothetical protein